MRIQWINMCKTTTTVPGIEKYYGILNCYPINNGELLKNSKWENSLRYMPIKDILMVTQRMNLKNKE